MYTLRSISAGGAQAGLYHHFGINKSTMDEKLFGVYEHDVYNDRPVLLRGFDENSDTPVIQRFLATN